MKIERLSENQIRCTLNKADLADKQMLLSELAYGTDKAKELFRELMQQASNELGFEVNDIPLMIEAIPVSQDCLVLIITKVEDPEELDTRFSRFTKNIDADDSEEDEEDDIPSDEMEMQSPGIKATDGLMQALGNLAEGISNALVGSGKIAKNAGAYAQQAASDAATADIFRVYTFTKLDDVITSAGLVKGLYDSENTLYKNPQDSRFYLYMTKDRNSDSDFVRSCNLISEYGRRMKTSYATPSHMEEHFKIIIDSNALQVLAEL